MPKIYATRSRCRKNGSSPLLQGCATNVSKVAHNRRLRGKTWRRAAAMGKHAAQGVDVGVCQHHLDHMQMHHTNRIDLIRPDAPALAAQGAHPVGVQTRVLVDPGRIDVLNATATALPRYDRTLPVELWYPAIAGTPAGTVYTTLLRDGHRQISLQGRACRDAVQADGAFPLVIVSHGYPGNRMLMGHLGENLASKGYVVASIDHTDSGYADKAAFGATLYNRPLDTGFVINALAGVADTSAVAIIGYSMGGYGALISGGAGLAEAVMTEDVVPPQGLLRRHMTPVVDTRLKAIIPIGAWGRQRGAWDAAGMAGLRVPALIVAGDADAVSGYADGMRLIFEQAVGTDRHLLTFQGAAHNAGAPIPAPWEAWEPSAHLDFMPFDHYADAVWDTVRMNNILQHYVTAFLGLHVKADAGMATYLAGDWQGFAPGTARGLVWETRGKGT
jgi:predicted dienelactone hydrolase